MRHLLLVRHGRSAHVHRGALLDREGMERWRTAYDAAGIADAPPPALVHEAALADRIVASDMPRAVASAERLAGGRAVTASPLFREVPLPIPTWLPGRAPLVVWGALISLRWGIDITRGRDALPEWLEQARAAAAWCDDACGPHGTVVVVTHGVFRRLLARRLAATGWRAAPGRRSYAPWSVWRLSRDTPSRDRA